MLPSFAATATPTATATATVPFVGRARAESSVRDPAQLEALRGSPGSGDDPDLDQTANGKLPLVWSCLLCEVAFGVKLPLVCSCLWCEVAFGVKLHLVCSCIWCVVAFGV